MSDARGSNGHREEGEVLAELQRFKGAKLVITLEAFEGHPFVGLRASDPERGSKYLSIKVKELDQVIAALQTAKAKIDGGR